MAPCRKGKKYFLNNGFPLINQVVNYRVKACALKACKVLTCKVNASQIKMLCFTPGVEVRIQSNTGHWCQTKGPCEQPEPLCSFLAVKSPLDLTN